ncbi:MAG TPA: DUF1801 domain-containing protein [Polyangia bacterium]
MAKKAAPATKKTGAKRVTRTSAGSKRPAAAKAKTKSASRSMLAPRADYGAPIEEFFARQSPGMRAIGEALRGLIEEAAPGAESSLKWGMPFFSLDGAMMCAIGGHKAHVNLILSGPPEAYPDPEGRLEGDGKTGRHLKLRSIDELPREMVRTWLRTAATLAKEKAK